MCSATTGSPRSSSSGFPRWKCARQPLCTAWNELQDIRRHLTLRHVIWRSFWHRDVRGILKPYWQLPYRQAFHDGVRVALLLVAVRWALSGQEKPGSVPALGRRQARTVLRIATTIAGGSPAIADVLDNSRCQPAGPDVLDSSPSQPSGKCERPVARRLRTRRWPGQDRTRSWPAAYNLACVYAAIAQDRSRRLEACRRGPEEARTVAEAERLEGELRDLVAHVVRSLDFALNNPECEMERPSEWIAHDPDFGFLRSRDDQFSAEFRAFLNAQEGRGYPPPLSTQPEAVAARRWPQGDLVGVQTVRTGYMEMTVAR